MTNLSMKWRKNSSASTPSDQLQKTCSPSSEVASSVHPQPLSSGNNNTSISTSTSTNSNSNSNHSNSSQNQGSTSPSRLFSLFKFGKRPKSSSSRQGSGSASPDPLYSSHSASANNSSEMLATATSVSVPSAAATPKTNKSSSQETLTHLSGHHQLYDTPPQIFERSVQALDAPSSASVCYTNTQINRLPSLKQLKSKSKSSLSIPCQSQCNSNNMHKPSNCSFQKYSSVSRKRSGSLSAPLHPGHLLTENYTSPILDSTVELITNKDLENVDVVQYPHSRPPLFRQSTSSNNVKFSRRSSQSNSRSQASLLLSSSPPGLRRAQTQPQVVDVPRELQEESRGASHNDNAAIFSIDSGCETPLSQSTDSSFFNDHAKSGRKSISFYSYSDLVNFERLSKTQNSRNMVLSPLNPADTREDDNLDAPEMRLNNSRHGSSEDRLPPLVDHFLSPDFVPPESNNDNNYIVASSSSPTVQSPIARQLSTPTNDSDDEGIVLYRPKSQLSSRVLTQLSRRSTNNTTTSNPDELVSIKSLQTNNSYFEDEMDGVIQQRILDHSISVCSAKDFIKSRSRELRKNFSTSASSVSNASLAPNGVNSNVKVTPSGTSISEISTN